MCATDRALTVLDRNNILRDRDAGLWVRQWCAAVGAGLQCCAASVQRQIVHS